jgi:hypothetical protein
MRTVDVLSGTSPCLHELLELADEESLLLKTSDGKEFMLSDVDDLSQEIQEIWNNPELLGFLGERSHEKETSSLDEVNRKLGL